MDKVRVRFAPSPTGALHIGGVRTALFNYLFAKHQQGDFVLRIEDTDQSRYVEKAEKYILDALDWLGISADEGPQTGGNHAPYRQSERRALYQKYADQLLTEGNAYLAFDTPDELDNMRQKLQASRMTNPQYDTITRKMMKNSLTLSEAEVNERIAGRQPYVVRIKNPEKEEVRFKDLVRGWVRVNTAVMDDKVLMKADGMPTYHLANVVDDHLMQISHVIRGEEWLPSTSIHVLLYQYFEWEKPEFAHLPLLLKADGNGKLSKRSADKAGFPIFPLSWEESDGNVADGFREKGFLPEALLNFLVLLGWNPGSEQEIFNLEEMIQSFSIERINKAGTKFDFEKAKWFNQQYIKQEDPEKFAGIIKDLFQKKHGIVCSVDKAKQLFHLFKDRITFIDELIEKGIFLFKEPEIFDEQTWKKKWIDSSSLVLMKFVNEFDRIDFSEASNVKNAYWQLLERDGDKPGKYMPSLRLALTGQGSGPDLMEILVVLEKEEVKRRLMRTIPILDKKFET